MKKVLRAIGIMSGTSMDGIDVALIDTDGRNDVRVLGGAFYHYAPGDRDILGKAVWDAVGVHDRQTRTDALEAAEQLVTERHMSAVREFMASEGLEASDIDVIGFHGQTVLHRPEQKLTIQLGDGDEMSQKLRVPVVYDFRADDVAAGGQGAPFVPVYHQAIVAASLDAYPAVVVNIGGVGNITFIGSDGTLLAFDTGPGNALIDDWVQLSGVRFDEGGALGLAGQVVEGAVEEMLSHPYFSQSPPKSLDRNDFSLDHVRGLSLEDGAATLARFTAASFARAVAYMPEEPKKWVVCGGGVKNAAIMRNMKKLCCGEVIAGQDLGWNTDLIEAQAFAYLAVRSLNDMPLTYPGTTGVPAPQRGGRLAYGAWAA